MNKNNTGISNSAALDKFYHSIKSELNIAKSPRNFSAGLHSWLRDAYQYNSPYSPFCWTSALIIFIEILALMLFHGYGSESFRLKSMAAEIFFLFLLLFMNIVIVGCDSWFRHTEMYAKAKTVLEAIEECKKQCPWDVGLYSHLHTPQSPCISSQWTYRNGELVNLPNHLLVEGDIILLRPGHAAPGNCKSIDKQFDTPVILNGGKVFAPVNEHLNESFSVPQARKPAKPAAFSMLETPYVKNFKLALQNSLNRPVTLFNKESHTVLFQYVERITIPVVLMITICVGGLHSAYFSPESSEWIKHLILRPALSILPLLPLALPIYWIILNAYGNARLLAIVEITKQEAKPLNIFEEMEEFNPPTVTCISFQELKPYFLSLLLQRRGYLWRSANLLHVLGSITALCCVDKKGILSWPNPTAEKVFFLKPSKSKSNSQDSSHLEASCDNLGESPGDTIESKSDSIELKKLAKISKRTDVKDHMYHPSSQVEVLDLTHNTNSPFGIQFDDPNWKSYIGNLKPLGLAILLNTCNPKAQEHYTRFSDHIACESLYNCAAVPVVNKRCLCELAKQIGFTNSVVDFYDLEQQLGVFRHVHPEVIQKGRLARSLNFPRLKMPFPNISCAIVKDLHRGSHQLFSQGTANLVLDACNEYWDGEDISVLMESDRKRILDFYHRSSLTAHCMGYAYGPISMPLGGAIPDAYMELPADGGHLYKSNSAVQNSARSWENHHSEKNSKNIIRNRCLSSDSLILSDPLGDGTTKNNSITKYCVEQIGNEIFIGMVTMQYQACPDFVQLIEELDKACIRFVHFSKENELRSRVFSEKMGLESGWNCHISLLSENPRQDATGSAQVEASVLCQRKLSAFQSGVLQPENSNRHSENPLRSVSAPSVINLDTTVVKFEDEISMHSKSDFSAAAPNVFAHREQLGSNVSVSVTDASSPHMHDSVSSIHDVLFSDDYHPSHSPSHITESTDQSAPVTFDMSNRAKLPKGTENIRPHIENIDNVPLQVSLFTDCTPEATREMICIMQEYGEVVCCLGSAANCQNMPIFLQADVSIAIEPLFPQLCVQQPVFDAQPYEQDQSIGPTDLSHILNSLPCSLSFHRENPISLYHLIMEARHFMSNMRSSFQFLLCCCLSVSLLQILAVVFFLPVPLSLGQLLWLNCLAIPLLSLSLMGNSADSQVTSAATGKNLKVISKQTVIFFIACYCAKFCPSVVAAIFCFACIVASTCEQHSSSDVPVSESCWIFTKIGKQGRDLANKESWSVGLIVAQNMVFFLMLLYFVLISAGFVHRSRLLWNGSPLTNRYWALTAPLVICLQAIFITADISLHASEAAESLSFLKSIPFYVWLIGLLWPFCLIPLNELVKRHEIKMIVRQQKRARLEFCTKLGMNSPF